LSSAFTKAASTTLHDNHTVLKPVYLLEVKGGQFTPLTVYQ
jgi:hypothetical protein